MTRELEYVVLEFLGERLFTLLLPGCSEDHFVKLMSCFRVVEKGADKDWQSSS